MNKFVSFAFKELDNIIFVKKKEINGEYYKENDIFS